MDGLKADDRLLAVEGYSYLDTRHPTMIFLHDTYSDCAKI